MQWHSLSGCEGSYGWNRLCSCIVFLTNYGETPTMQWHSLPGCSGEWNRLCSCIVSLTNFGDTPNMQLHSFARRERAPWGGDTDYAAA